MTSGTPGALTLAMALAMAALSGGAFWASALGRTEYSSLGRRAYYMQVFLAAAASLYLFILIFSHDFSIKYVHDYSSSDLPTFFLMSTFWAGQEGTYLLWFLLSSLFGLAILKRGGQYTSTAMVFYSLINIFLTVMLTIVTPFKSLGFMPPEGAGLNPLLQDYWMVIHPPVMFCAFAMAGIPFALGMAALVKRDFSGWPTIAFPFVAINALLFFAANVLGGYWAYETLGWGGYWAWDPVENTSFVPWLATLALLHGMIIEKRSGSLRRINILLAASLFLLVVYGTFLTRSGVLADFSVHSFVDLGANGILIGFMIGAVALVLGLFFLRQTKDTVGKPLKYGIFSFEFTLLVGLTLLFALAFLVLFWSSLPLVTKLLGITPAAADISTYNAFAFPFAIIICLFLTISPFVQGYGLGGTLRPGTLYLSLIPLVLGIIASVTGFIEVATSIALIIYLAVTIIYSGEAWMRRRLFYSHLFGLGAVVLALIYGVRIIEYLFFIEVAVTAAGAHILLLRNILFRNIRAAGGYLSHLGLGMMLVGILASSAFNSDHRLVLPRHTKDAAFGYNIAYHGTSAAITDSRNEILLTLEKDGAVREGRPGMYFSQKMDGMMKRPHIVKSLTRDIYLAPLEIQALSDSGGLALRKGESRQIGGYDIKFLNFEMLSHGGDEGVSVAAVLEVKNGTVTDTVRPIMTSGGGGLKGEPVALFADSEHQIRVDGISAGEGLVSLSIPGLAESGPPDQLILEVSEKPAINLVWLGSIFICVGIFLSFFRRLKA